MAENVIWIFGDQHRGQALGFAGDRNLRTPAIDQLAREGIWFPNAVAGCPWCTPFRAALLTSRYIHEACRRTPEPLDPALPTIADALNDAGYHTAWFGKWHLSGSNRKVLVPRERRGRFATWIGYENNNAQYDCHLHGHDESGRDDTDPLAEPLESYETDALTDRLIGFLQSRQGDSGGGTTPFFAVLSVQPPHDPFVAPEAFHRRHRPGDLELRRNVPPIPRIEEQARRDLAGYYAQIENLDWNVGRIRNALDRCGLADNTHLFFFSDHGDMQGSHGYFRKSTPYEEALRVPCVVRPAGGRNDATAPVSSAPFNHVDFIPTSLGACGIGIPEWCRGTDYSGDLVHRAPKSSSKGPRSAYLQQCVRKAFQSVDRTWRGIRTRDGWKYVVLENQPFGLFDLNEDPFELNNLAFKPEHRDIRAELQEELAEWIERTGDRFPLPEV